MAKKTPKQVKPKTGLARCMELASNKKGLIFISAILSSLASIGMSDTEIGDRLKINRSTSFRSRKNSLEEIKKKLKENMNDE